MSAVIGGDLMYYTPRVLAVTHTMSTTALGGEDGELLRNNDDDDTTKEKADSAIDSTSDEKLLHGSDHERRQFQYSGKKQTTEHQQQKKKKCKVIWIKRGKDGQFSLSLSHSILRIKSLYLSLLHNSNSFAAHFPFTPRSSVPLPISISIS